MRTLLFVYGTLKRGGRGNRWLMNQEFLRDAVTTPEYRLYDLGSYPGMVRDPANGLEVQGELWSVDQDCLNELDDYEFAPTLYTREVVAVKDSEGPVYSYLYNQQIGSSATSGSFWPFPARSSEPAK